MQTGREAIQSLFDGKPADYVPLYDSPWGDTVKRWREEGLSEEVTDIGSEFCFDMVGCGGWFKWHAKTDGVKILEENDEWKIVENGNGAILKWWKEKSGTPEHIDFKMNSREIWEKEYKPHLLEFDPARLGDVEASKKALAKNKAAGKWTFFGSTQVWETLRGSLGDVNMYMALIEDPDWIKDFNRVYTDLYLACYKHLFDEVGLPDGVWIYEDLGYRERLFCSPETLEKLIFPYYAETVDYFHSLGLKVVLHSCGYQEPMIPLAIKAGFDGLNPMEVKAGNDIFKFAEEFGDELVFIGGFDARVLESGDEARIKDNITAFINGMKERNARFIYGSDHSLSTDISYQSFLYSLDVYNQLKNY